MSNYIVLKTDNDTIIPVVLKQTANMTSTNLHTVHMCTEKLAASVCTNSAARQHMQAPHRLETEGKLLAFLSPQQLDQTPSSVHQLYHILSLTQQHTECLRTD